MSTAAETISQTAVCTVEITPSVVTPRAELSLRAVVVCTPARDLRGRTVLLSEASGRRLADLEIAAFDGVANATGPCAITAPPRAGAHVWRATVEIGEDRLLETDVPIEVRPHASRVVAWGAPPTVVVGAPFAVEIGGRSAAACDQSGRGFEIRDEAGGVLASGALGDAARPGTEALYCAQIEMKAPETAGLRRWLAVFPATDGDEPHDEGVASFGVNVVERPEARILVQAIDRASRLPIPGAQVVMHPYRAAADAEGRIELVAPRGRYTLFVSGPKHVTSRHAVDLAEDQDMVVDLMLESPSARE